MPDMVLGKRRDEEITMVVAFVFPEFDSASHPQGGFFEILREELVLLVEVVGCALWGFKVKVRLG